MRAYLGWRRPLSASVRRPTLSRPITGTLYPLALLILSGRRTRHPSSTLSVSLRPFASLRRRRSSRVSSMILRRVVISVFLALLSGLRGHSLFATEQRPATADRIGPREARASSSTSSLLFSPRNRANLAETRPPPRVRRTYTMKPRPRAESAYHDDPASAPPPREERISRPAKRKRKA